jgi:hypothetical protein
MMVEGCNVRGVWFDPIWRLMPKRGNVAESTGRVLQALRTRKTDVCATP